MQAAIYVWTATENAAVLADQERRCRTFAAQQGWDVAGVWVDVGSGLTRDRSGLDALRAVIRAGRVAALVAVEPSRFSRDQTVLAGLLTELDAAGVVVAWVDDAPPNLDRWSSVTSELSESQKKGLRAWRRRGPGLLLFPDLLTPELSEPKKGPRARPSARSCPTTRVRPADRRRRGEH